VISAKPEVWVCRRDKLQDDAGLLILASDGIWDVMNEQEVGHFVRFKLAELGFFIIFIEQI
jgi:serine/threonine protein phosphatase PrpC